MDRMPARGADTPQFQSGLEGVCASSSGICFVDGQEGRLLYRGYDIHDLAEHSTFEEVVYLLWHGDLPARAQLDALRHELGAVRALPAAVQGLLTGLPRAAPPPARPCGRGPRAPRIRGTSCGRSSPRWGSTIPTCRT